MYIHIYRERERGGCICACDSLPLCIKTLSPIVVLVSMIQTNGSSHDSAMVAVEDAFSSGNDGDDDGAGGEEDMDAAEDCDMDGSKVEVLVITVMVIVIIE